MTKETKEVWLDQMHIFPEQGDAALKYEHDYPYAVEYETTTGKTKTRKLTEGEIVKIRAFNNFPAEQIVSEEGGTEDEE